MARIECELEETLVKHPQTKKNVDGLCVTCGMCDHSVESPGRSEDSVAVQNLLSKLRQTCPHKEFNNYRIRTEE